MLANDVPSAPPWFADAERLRALLGARLPVTALCHENPDGDTIGAAVAIALAARALGCTVELIVEDVPRTYEPLVYGVPTATRPTLPPGLAVVCDAATAERVGRVATECRDWLAEATIVVIDHHVTNRGFGALNIVDVDAAATCEIVVELLEHLEVPLDRRIATALLTGIVRDSNGFSDESTRPRTLLAAAAAMKAGADLAATFRSTIVDMSQQQMNLWGCLLARVSDGGDPRIVHTTLTEADLAAAGASQADAEGLAEFLLRGSGVDVAVLFRELSGGTRVSLRTTGAADAAAISAKFGGGGHRRRAGCFVAAPVADARPQVLAVARVELG